MFEPTIRTGRERFRIFFRILLFLVGAAVFLVAGAAFAAVVTGQGLRFPKTSTPCQTGADELALYVKEEATQLLAQSTWVIGVYDPASADQIEKLVGRTRIVTPTRSSGHRFESLHDVECCPPRNRNSSPTVTRSSDVAASPRSWPTLAGSTPPGVLAAKISKEIAQVTAHVAKHCGRLQLQSRSTTDLSTFDLDPQSSASPTLTHH